MFQLLCHLLLTSCLNVIGHTQCSWQDGTSEFCGLFPQFAAIATDEISGTKKHFCLGSARQLTKMMVFLWNPFNFFILETSRPFGIPNWRFNFDSFIDRPFPSHIVFGFIPPKPGARAGHFVKGQSAAIGHGAVTSKTTTVSAVISDNQTIQNKFGHLMYIHVFHRCFWLQKEDRNSRVHNVYNCITPSFMSQPHHDGETPEDELYDLLTCHRNDPRYLLIGNFRCFFFFSGVPLFVRYQWMVDWFNIYSEPSVYIFFSIYGCSDFCQP